MTTYFINTSSWELAAQTSPASPSSSRRRKEQMTLADAFAAKYADLLFILDIFKAATGSAATWRNLTKSNLCAFVAYLQKHYAPNTANQYAVRLKAVLNIYADEIKLPKDFAKILSPRRVASTAIHLDENELDALRGYQPKSTNELFVRNMFLISAYTGCRHIDAEALRPSNIRGNEVIFIAQKTHKEARLPLKPIVADYIRNTPRVILSDISYNKIIRKICRAAGITERVKILKAGKEVELDKCAAVSSHTARRSFATCLYLKGVDIYTISRLLQHSDTRLTAKYICVEMRPLDDAAMKYFD